MKIYKEKTGTPKDTMYKTWQYLEKRYRTFRLTDNLPHTPTIQITYQEFEMCDKYSYIQSSVLFGPFMNIFHKT